MSNQQTENSADSGQSDSNAGLGVGYEFVMSGHDKSSWRIVRLSGYGYSPSGDRRVFSCLLIDGQDNEFAGYRDKDGLCDFHADSIALMDRLAPNV